MENPSLLLVFAVTAGILSGCSKPDPYAFSRNLREQNSEIRQEHLAAIESLQIELELLKVYEAERQRVYDHENRKHGQLVDKAIFHQQTSGKIPDGFESALQGSVQDRDTQLKLIDSVVQLQNSNVTSALRRAEQARASLTRMQQ